MKTYLTSHAVQNLERLSEHPPVYPFAAIVGLEELKLALIINAINPRIGGVLILSLIHI